MNKDVRYPEYADVVRVSGGNVDFIFDYETREEEKRQELDNPNRVPANDRVIRDTSPHVASWENYRSRYQLRQITARMDEAGLSEKRPLILLSDIGLPEKFSTADDLLVAAGALGLMNSSQSPQSRRKFISVLGGIGILTVMGAYMYRGSADEDDPLNYILDGRSAYRAQAELSMLPIIRERLGLKEDETLRWAVKAGSLHREGFRKGHGLPALLNDSSRRERILERDRELFEEARKMYPQEHLSWPFLYIPEADGVYKTVEIYSPDGRTADGLTSYSLYKKVDRRSNINS